jgi:hypothetical protein
MPWLLQSFGLMRTGPQRSSIGHLSLLAAAPDLPLTRKQVPAQLVYRQPVHCQERLGQLRLCTVKGQKALERGLHQGIAGTGHRVGARAQLK